MPGRPPLSLKGRALAALARREQSRLELRRKLLRPAAARPKTRRGHAVAAEPDADWAGDGEAEDPAVREAAVEAVLDALEAEGLLSAERFVESRLHARSARFGARRIAAELAQHGLALPPDAARALRGSELERASALHARRFGAPPADLAERARQTRFLVARGFAPETVHRLMKGLAAAG